MTILILKIIKYFKTGTMDHFGS